MRTKRALSLAVIALLFAVGCGGDGEDADPTTPTTEQLSSTTIEDPLPQGSTRKGDQDPPEDAKRGEGRDEALPELERANDGGGAPEPTDVARQRAAADAEAAYRAYVTAINEADGAALCDLLPPNAVEALKPPEQAASCAGSLGESIGYRDPRGYPVWRKTTISGIESAVVSRELDSSRLSAAIVTEFADRSQPSVESDIVYLERSGGAWRLAKPTAALYRAIGRPELPPSVITPP